MKLKSNIRTKKFIYTAFITIAVSTIVVFIVKIIIGGTTAGGGGGAGAF
ncbi:hypothetical protein ES705_34161 [subsurface metagenome]|jgi:hypothetical protein